MLRRALREAEDRRIARARAGGAFVIEERKIIHSPRRHSKVWVSALDDRVRDAHRDLDKTELRDLYFGKSFAPGDGSYDRYAEGRFNCSGRYVWPGMPKDDSKVALVELNKPC